MRLLLLASVCSVCTNAATADDQPPPPQRTRQQDAVGGLAALNVYAMHGGLGLAGKGLQNGTHTQQEIAHVTAQVIKLSDVAVKLLKEAAREDPALAKAVPVDRLVEAYYLVERDARLLQAAAKSAAEGDLKKYQAAREETWKKVAKLLGVDPDAASPPGAARDQEPRP